MHSSVQAIVSVTHFDPCLSFEALHLACILASESNVVTSSLEALPCNGILASNIYAVQSVYCQVRPRDIALLHLDLHSRIS